MKLIPVYGRQGIVSEVMVDDVDYDWLMQWRWHFPGSTGNPEYPKYAARNEATGLASPRQRKVYMHKEILTRMGHENFQMVDHINRCTHDNQRENLRPATPLTNMQNRVWRNKPGRKQTLPEAEPRPCQFCGIVFTPRRKSQDASSALTAASGEEVS